MQNNMSLATEKWETEGEFGSCTQPISAEAYDKAVRGLLGSVYQRDYMGIPSGKNKPLFYQESNSRNAMKVF